MYIKIGRYTYSCYEPVQVGDLVLTPPPPWGGKPEVCRVDEINVEYPKDFSGKIVEVSMVLKPDKIVARMTDVNKLALIRKEADALGYRLSKKPARGIMTQGNAD